MSLRTTQFRAHGLYKLVRGSVGAQVIAIAAAPLLTRLYSPEEFGEYTICIAALSIFGPVLALKYDVGIVSSNSDESSADLIRIAAFTSIIVVPIIVCSYTVLVLTDVFDAHGLLWASGSLLLILLLQGAMLIANAQANRERDYDTISNATLIRSAGSNVSFLALGLAPLGSFGLLLGQILGMTLGTLAQTPSFRRANRIVHGRDRAMAFASAKNFAVLPKYSAPAALLSAASFSIIVVFVGRTFGAAEAGLYAMGYRLLGVPFVVISANVAKYYLERASSEKRTTGSFAVVHRKTMKVLAAFSIVSMSALALAAPTLFQYIFGDAWRDAGIMVSLLTPMFAVRLVGDAVMPAFIVAGRASLELLVNGALFASTLAVFSFVVLTDATIEAALASLSISCVVVYVAALVGMSRLSKIKSRLA